MNYQEDSDQEIQNDYFSSDEEPNEFINRFPKQNGLNTRRSHNNDNIAEMQGSIDGPINPGLKLFIFNLVVIKNQFIVFFRFKK